MKILLAIVALLLIAAVAVLLFLKKKQAGSLPLPQHPSTAEEVPLPIPQPEATTPPVQQDTLAEVNAFVEQQQYDNAIASLKKILLTNPNHEEAVLKLLQVYGITNNTAAFEKLHQKIHEVGSAEAIAQPDYYASLIAEEPSVSPASTAPTLEVLDFETGESSTITPTLTTPPSATDAEEALLFEDFGMEDLVVEQTTPAAQVATPTYGDTLTSFDFNFDTPNQPTQNNSTTPSESFLVESPTEAPDDSTLEFVFDDVSAQTHNTLSDNTPSLESNDALLLESEDALLFETSIDNHESANLSSSVARADSTANEDAFDFSFDDLLNTSTHYTSEAPSPSTPSDISPLFDETTQFDELNIEAVDIADNEFDTPKPDVSTDNLELSINAQDDGVLDADFGLADFDFNDTSVQTVSDGDNLALDIESGTLSNSSVALVSDGDNLSLDIETDDQFSAATESFEFDTQIDNTQSLDVNFFDSSKASIDALSLTEDFEFSDNLSAQSSLDDLALNDDISSEVPSIEAAPTETTSIDVADALEVDTVAFDTTANFDIAIDDTSLDDNHADSTTDDISLVIDQVASPTPATTSDDTLIDDDFTWQDDKVTTDILVEDSVIEHDAIIDTPAVASATPPTNIIQPAVQFDDTAQITLDLAKQYLDLGEHDSAKRLLAEVVYTGTQEQQHFAQSLLERLG